jgi:hypothetical protein
VAEPLWTIMGWKISWPSNVRHASSVRRTLFTTSALGDGLAAVSRRRASHSGL